MLIEVTCAAELCSRSCPTVTQLKEPETAKRFSELVANHLTLRCKRSTWDNAHPMRGNAYRAVSCFQGAPLDDVLRKAALELQLDPEALREALPKDFVVWVDPGSVAYRVGDYGTIVSLMENGKFVTATPTGTSNGVVTNNTSRAVTISPHTPTVSSPYLSSSPLPFNQTGLLTAAGYFASQQSNSNQYPNLTPASVSSTIITTTSSSTMSTAMKSPNGTWQYQQQQQQQFQESQRVSMNVFAANNVFSPAPVVHVRISSPPASPRQQPASKRPAYVMAN